ncbi:hypothetical protein ABER61_25660 [Brevibacillus formosus]|uniref:Uncharacterized protein n=1 Tax=Brevibacillus formosus TaxID=54913 RepID=A0A837KM82_9BACL|nr:hypothetical protein [Brevibacillus formosus]KLH98152.1 hypothetical protein AA984_14115 [Brevibacillus formosus]MED1956975.1 hypothetical protein [Brevibacillus formosus]PSJ96454.1 hypothetical protein C7R91_11925 [Brevibacillus formosus]
MSKTFDRFASLIFLLGVVFLRLKKKKSRSFPSKLMSGWRCLRSQNGKDDASKLSPLTIERGLVFLYGYVSNDS